MNERIKECWLKAAREDSDPDNWDTQEQFIKRFALLIVRECADIASINQHQYHSVGKYVLEHFGVEE